MRASGTQCWLRFPAWPFWRAADMRASISAVLDGLCARSGSADGRLSQNAAAEASTAAPAMSAIDRQRDGRFLGAERAGSPFARRRVRLGLARAGDGTAAV